jgi:hypothetical protein
VTLFLLRHTLLICRPEEKVYRVCWRLSVANIKHLQKSVELIHLSSYRMMSATAHSQTSLHHGRDFSSRMTDLVDGEGHRVHYHSDEDQARYLYAKYFPLPSSDLTCRMLFEHTQRQYARACNRIIRQGQMQQENETPAPEVNGTM